MPSDMSLATAFFLISRLNCCNEYRASGKNIKIDPWESSTSCIAQTADDGPPKTNARLTKFIITPANESEVNSIPIRSVFFLFFTIRTAAKKVKPRRRVTTAATTITRGLPASHFLLARRRQLLLFGAGLLFPGHSSHMWF